MDLDAPHSADVAQSNDAVCISASGNGRKKRTVASLNDKDAMEERNGDSEGLCDGHTQNDSKRCRLDLEQQPKGISELRAQKEAQRREKERERAEKQALRDQLRAQKELQRQEKEKEKAEKEAKRAEKEAKKEQMRLQKEATRQEKELKEIEKEQKRREKEEADRKKQMSLQKQATIMDKFLQAKKEQCSPPSTSKTEEKSPRWSQEYKKNFSYVQASQEVMLAIDQELSTESVLSSLEILGKHKATWKNVRKDHMSKTPLRWGVRRHPKVKIVKELKLNGPGGESCSTATPSTSQSKMDQCSKHCPLDDENEEDIELLKLEEWNQENQDVAGNSQNSSRYLLLRGKRKKLLQFDGSHRPAYYGTFSKTSQAIGPRHPFVEDPLLDYDVDSDEEWEEEEPGESLSDCDKDEEEDKTEAVEEDEDSADGFVVPDGYLSENEGIEVVKEDPEIELEEDISDPATCPDLDPFKTKSVMDEHLRTFNRGQRLLHKATEQALRDNKPFIIVNFCCSSSPNLKKPQSKTQELCLHALTIQVFTKDIPIEPPKLDGKGEEENDGSKKAKKGVPTFPDSAISELATFILSMSSQGIKKLTDAAAKKFSAYSKSQIETKIREMCDYVDGHWKVKNDIIKKFEIKVPATAMNKTPLNMKPITNFFSKRCSPLEETTVATSAEDKCIRKIEL